MIKPIDPHHDLCQYYLTSCCSCNIIEKAYKRGYENACIDMQRDNNVVF